MERTLPGSLRPPAPVPRGHWITRPRLLGQLVGSSARTVVVTGPAGYGKTTLLVQWQEHRAETRPFLWVTIHPEDDATTVLATISEDLAQVISTSTDETPFVLVLDDLTTGTTPAHVPVAAALSTTLPSTATLVVATRVAPETSSAWSPAGPVVRFGPQDLGFTPMETSQVLRTITDREPSTELARRLCEWSEGWPAAVCVAASSLGHDPGAAGPPVTEIGAERVREFVESEVVAALDDEAQDLLVRTSVLDRLTPALCAAVVGRDDAGTSLQRITRSHLLVQDADGETAWWRYHHLVAGALRLRLETTQAEVLPVLHRRAARWHARVGLVDEALHHAAASGDDRLLAELLGEHWSHYVHTGRYEDARPWLRACGDAVTRNPDLAIAGAWLAGLAGESEAVERLLPVAATGTPDLPVGGFAALRSALALVSLFMTHDPLSSLEPEIEQAASVESRNQTVWQATAELGQAWVRYLRGRPGVGDIARDAAATAGPDQVLVRSLALALAALAAVRDGQDDEAALRLADESMAAVTDADLQDLGGAWGPFTAQGTVMARQGRLQAAAEACGRGVELARGASGMTPWPGVVALEHLARVQLDLGRAAAAMDAVDEARALLARYGHDDSVFTARIAQLADEAANSPAQLGAELSDRELVVLRLLQGPLRGREIARELDVSPNTLKTHLRSVYRKLGVSSRRDAVARARHRGVL